MKYLFLISTTTILSLLLTSCSVQKVDSKYVNDLIFNSNEGILAGVGIGMQWKKIEKNLHKDWNIKDSERTDNNEDFIAKQKVISHQFGNEDNRIHILVDLDNNGIITRLSYYFRFSDVNYPLLDEFQYSIANYWTNTRAFKGTDDVYTKKHWFWQSPNNKEYSINFFRLDYDDNRGSLTIDVN